MFGPRCQCAKKGHKKALGHSIDAAKREKEEGGGIERWLDGRTNTVGGGRKKS